MQVINKILFGFCALCVVPAFSWEMSILLVRHGQTDWNLNGKVQTYTDIPLNQTGVMQAKATAEKLQNDHSDISTIYSSNLTRAMTTAKSTADLLGLNIGIKKEFREVNIGIAEGMQVDEKNKFYASKFKEVEENYPNLRDRWNQQVIPGEETMSELISRVKSGVLEVIEEHPREKVAIFSHKRAIQAFLADIEEVDHKEFTIPNCGICEVVYDSENTEKPFKIVSIKSPV